jgi:hypothetical protein
MSQQRMDYDEGNRQQQEPRVDNYESGYRDPFTGSYTGQKLSQQGSWNSNAPAGMRLALAIVSIVMLVPLAGIIFGTSMGGGFYGGGLIALGLICFTIMVVNVAFNYKR